jgi:hypothetical protein
MTTVDVLVAFRAAALIHFGEEKKWRRSLVPIDKKALSSEKNRHISIGLCVVVSIRKE